MGWGLGERGYTSRRVGGSTSDLGEGSLGQRRKMGSEAGTGNRGSQCGVEEALGKKSLVELWGPRDAAGSIRKARVLGLCSPLICSMDGLESAIDRMFVVCFQLRRGLM